jgi:membrane-bound ClpP family serine protease
MQVRYIFLLLLALIFVLNENLLQAAQIDVYATEEYANIRLIGEIQKGDAEIFKIIVEYLREEKITVNMLLLASIGGDAIEAMQIGTIVRESFIPTVMDTPRD